MQTVALSFGWIVWSFLSLLPVDFSANSVMVRGGEGKKAHPFHVSVTEVDHNQQEATLEMQCKLFTDDFEAAIGKLYNRKVDLVNASLHGSMDSLVRRYVLSHLQLTINGKILVPSYLGFEQEKEAVYVYVEYPKTPALIQEVAIFNNLLYDYYTDQINIVHFKSGDKRKSVKLDYPDTTIRFSL
jgi:hypothetical protein